jgi:hypothetical protein
MSQKSKFGGRQAFIAVAIATVQSVHAQFTNAVLPAEPVTKLPEVIVTGTADVGSRPGWLQEEQFVGPYQQPEWTTARRFPGTRVYLQQMPWETGFEQWVRFQHFRDGTDEARMQEEFEIGLPHRFQLDLYETWTIDQNRDAGQDECSAEVRYALADWGKIPLNPTLYLEYAQHSHDQPNTLEGKLLLGTDFSPRWHWGLNLACEQELSGVDNTELAASQGFSYTVVDQKLGAGVEMEYYHEKANGSPSQNEFLIGPSLQWFPISRCHVDLAPLFGCTHDSPTVEAYLVIGIDFGTGHDREHYAPASLRGQ